MMQTKDTYHSNGVAWEHWPENSHEWEQWVLYFGNGRVRVQRTYPDTALCPRDFCRDEWKAEYLIEYWTDGRPGRTSLPLDTPLDEVLAMAVAHARIG